MRGCRDYELLAARLETLSSGRHVGYGVPDYGTMLIKFEYSAEDFSRIMEPMMATGKKPVGSNGYDALLAVLPIRPQSLSNHFRQQFAQITSPPPPDRPDEGRAWSSPPPDTWGKSSGTS